ncbi:MAG: TraB/VirB10 family protein [Candidatus Bathyarchaeia archaeon]
MAEEKTSKIESIKKAFGALPPEHKRKVVLLLLAVGIIIISIVGYYWSRSGEKPRQKEVAKQEEIKLDTGVLQKTQYAESQKKIKELEEQVKLLQEERQKAEEEAKRKEEEEKARKEKEEKERALKAQMPPSPPPPPPVSAGQAGQVAGQPGYPPAPMQEKPEVIGGIGIVSQQIQAKQESAKGESAKKKYYLPTSFMEATLLSGLDAPAVSKAEGHPMPALFRVKAPAVLPNKVKANLKGCFVIAEGLGNLADERAHLRLVSLSCIDRKGNAVIDQKIKGFVVDSDGKIGLRGRVVSKMGAHIARSLIAGFFGGLGQVAGTQAYSYTVTGAGTVSTIEPGKAAQAVLGAGIQQAAQNLQKFYLELAQQTIPVIEIQATRNVTLVVSEGVELEIKEYSFKD